MGFVQLLVLGACLRSTLQAGFILLLRVLSIVALIKYLWDKLNRFDLVPCQQINYLHPGKIYQKPEWYKNLALPGTPVLHHSLETLFSQYTGVIIGSHPLGIALLCCLMSSVLWTIVSCNSPSLSIVSSGRINLNLITLIGQKQKS